MSPLAVHLALALALAESLGLAALLALRVKGVAGGRLLVLFLVGVAIWITGTELPSWLGQSAIPVAGWLVALASLTAVVFLHFSIRFAGAAVPGPALAACYALAAMMTGLAIAQPPGRFVPWAGFELFFRPNAMGWAVGLIWVMFGTLGHLVLFLSWLGADPARRRQLAAAFLSSGLGLASMSGYALAALGLLVYPWPLLLLPLYPLVLVYGILRYRLMVANAWARRALAFTLLVGVLLLALGGLALLPWPLGRTGGVATRLGVPAALVLALALVDPARRLAGRIVYPGAEVTDAMLADWRRRLGQAADYPALAAAAETVLSDWQHLAIRVQVAPGSAAVPPGSPAMLCQRGAEGWRSTLCGWEGAPPGPRQAAQTFGAILAEAAQRLEQALAFAERERNAQQQARLAELGALAATVAHDIRNPLNIIAMAAASAPPDSRAEIQAQIQRLSLLSRDLLDYAKPWCLAPAPLDLAEQARMAAAGFPVIRLDETLSAPLPVTGDARRLHQALVNLLENAVAAGPNGKAPAHVAIAAERRADGGVLLHVCDDGVGIPREIRDTLFQPFVSRSAHGTGLGLAIVAKVMAAHHGQVALTERAGWTTCFTLAFPAPTP